MLLSLLMLLLLLLSLLFVIVSPDMSPRVSIKVRICPHLLVPSTPLFDRLTYLNEFRKANPVILLSYKQPNSKSTHRSSLSDGSSFQEQVLALSISLHNGRESDPVRIRWHFTSQISYIIPNSGQSLKL